jgi:hypothetical protein
MNQIYILLKKKMRIKQELKDIENKGNEIILTSGNLNSNINLEIGYMLEYP